MKKLIISKALRDWYKIPESIAHKVLADRMGKRDPGNKPSVGSRIPFVYFQTKKKVKLQGDKIEHPDYMRKHELTPDYPFYITNQIMKPVKQILDLGLTEEETTTIFENNVESEKQYCFFIALFCLFHTTCHGCAI